MSNQEHEKERGHKSPIVVTAAIIKEGSRVLIAKRKLDSKLEGGKWEFPGGKVEYGEHPETGLVREIKEELNLEIEIDSFFDLVSHVYPKGGDLTHIVLLCYLCRKTGGELKPLQVEDAIWIKPADLKDYTFAAADVPIVERLSEFMGSNSLH